MAEQNIGAPQAPIRFDAPAPVPSPDGIVVGGGGAPTATLSCAKCAGAIGAYYYEAAGAVYCARCKRELEEARPAAGGFGRGALFGLGAAILGAIGYWAFIKITSIDWALVSIAVAAFVATAIRKGNGGRGSRRFQVLAVALTYLAIGGAYAPLIIAGMRESGEKAAPTSASADSSASPAADSAATSIGTGAASSTVAAAPGSARAVAESNAARSSPARAILLFVGAVLLVALAGPVLSVLSGGFPGSIINIAIIGFALLRAWRMAGAPGATGGHAFTGPYKVGARESAS